MKIKLFSTLLFMAFLFSCKDEDTTGSYIGIWTASRIDVTDCENFSLNDSRPVQCTDNTCYKITFTDSATYTFQKGLEFENGTWAADGVSLTFCRDDEGEQICKTATGVISASGMRLSFVEGNEGCVTAYVMSKEDEEVEDPDDN
ncbi:MAG: hypothetical protein ABJP45_06895 [Cyclobacteriaceae bacterium]